MKVTALAPGFVIGVQNETTLSSHQRDMTKLRLVPSSSQTSTDMSSEDGGQTPQREPRREEPRREEPVDERLKDGLRRLAALIEENNQKKKTDDRSLRLVGSKSDELSPAGHEAMRRIDVLAEVELRRRRSAISAYQTVDRLMQVNEGNFLNGNY
jgi:hypothetical protein